MSCGKKGGKEGSTIAERGRYPHIPLKGFFCSRKRWDGSGKVEPPCSCLAKISLHHSNMPTHREQATYYLEVADEIPATADVVFGPAA